ncbi:MAG: 3'(2'),5'-bisphosphate nucleotidase CysQ [Bacteroidia bacterium]
MKNLLTTAVLAAIEAGKTILKIYSEDNFNVEFKEDDSPLTRADKASHDIIVSYLGKTKYPVVSEEDVTHHTSAERLSWQECWMVDPLDGTKEFIKRNGEFTVNIAFIRNGKSVAGVIYTPVKDTLHYASENNGSFIIRNASSLKAEDLFKQAERLPLRKRPEVFTLVGSRSHSSPETEAYVQEMKAQHGDVNFVAAGSSLKFCLVAEGEAHAYPRFAPTMEWDTAAGQIIAEEAGCRVVVWPEKQELRYNREELRNPWFLVSA